jgi:hypothetical protein
VRIASGELEVETQRDPIDRFGQIAAFLDIRLGAKVPLSRELHPELELPLLADRSPRPEAAVHLSRVLGIATSNL